MKRSTRLSVRVALAAGLAAVALSARASAQEDQFRRGVDAYENKQWQAAAALLREAIKIRPDESTARVGANPIFRTGGTEYLPYYFLGEALYGAGDCSSAVTAWANSEAQRVIQKARPEFYKRLQNGYLECEKKGVLPPTKLEPALTRLSGLIKEVTTEYGSVQTLGQSNPEIWKADGNLRDQLERARGEIANATARWEAARSSRLQTHIDESANAVGRARSVLVTVESTVRTTISNQQSAQKLAQAVGESITAAESLRAEIEGKKVSFTPAMTTNFQEGRDALGRARERLSEGQRTLSVPTLNVARTLAQDASTRLRQVLDEMGNLDREAQRRLVNEALTRALDASTLLDAAVAALDRYSLRTSELPPEKAAESEAARRDVDRVRRRLDGARKSDNADIITGATRTALELRDRLNLIIEAFGPLTLRDRGIRAPLQEGADLYLKGQYQQAVAALGDTNALGPDVPFRLHFHLFKAAALYELYLRSGEKDQALRAQALAEAERSKAIDSAFQPDGRAFSPRFLSFYQSVAAPATSAPAPAPPAAAPAPQAAGAPGAL